MFTKLKFYFKVLLELFLQSTNFIKLIMQATKSGVPRLLQPHFLTYKPFLARPIITSANSSIKIIYPPDLFILHFIYKKFVSMIISTTDFIPGKEIAEVIEIARGSTVRARNIGRDIFAGLKNLVGGEISEYTELMADAREQAIARMIADAEQLGADAVINVRFTTSMVMQGCSEILAYGTAVKLK